MSETSVNRTVNAVNIADHSEQHPLSPLPQLLVQQWRTKGYSLVDGLLPADVVNSAREEINERFPPPKTEAEVEEYRKRDFGDGLTFPCDCDAVSALTLNENFLHAVKQLLGTEDFILSQADLWPKMGAKGSTGPFDNHDQRIHVDYGNHTLVNPPGWHTPEAVAAIIYLDHSTETAGGTAVVPRKGDDDPLYDWSWNQGVPPTPGVGHVPYINNRTACEKYFAETWKEGWEFRQRLYAEEKYVAFKPGTVLLYRHDIWHRGTPVSDGKLRRAHNLVFKKRDVFWLTGWNAGVAREMYSRSQFLEKLMGRLSPFQRTAIGFPPPGHAYWNDHTLAMCKRRWESFGMDMSPYEEAQSTVGNKRSRSNDELVSEDSGNMTKKSSRAKEDKQASCVMC